MNLLVRFIRIKLEEAYSIPTEIKAVVPQGSVVDLVIYLLYNWDISQLENNTIETIVDKNAIIVIGNNNTESTENLQSLNTRVVKKVEN